MKDFFKQVFVISLDNDEGRRRRARLLAHLEEVGWPFCKVDFFQAVHGDTVGVPDWWKPGGGAWGCYRSHLSILERCLNSNTSPILILEDDVIFVKDFAKKVKAYLEHLPDDWGLAYLGGQHLKTEVEPPKPVNEWVSIPYNVNRTHAYALRSQEFMRKLYRWLLELPVFSEAEQASRPFGWRMFDNQGNGCHHIDHRIGQWTEMRPGGIYAPAVWLAGQSAGTSDVSAQKVEERWWDDRCVRGGKAKDLLLVLGLHNSGSTVIARLLHELGVYFGEDLGEGPWGTAYEEPKMRSFCEEILRFPFTGFAPGKSWAIEKMKLWLQQHRLSAITQQYAGIKFPFWCQMTDVLPSEEPKQLRIVHCSRPLDKCIAGLKRRIGNSYPTELLAEHQRFLWDGKEAFLSKTKSPVLNVDFGELVHNPVQLLKEITVFLNLPTPSDDRCQDICKFINPEQCHY